MKESGWGGALWGEGREGGVVERITKRHKETFGMLDCDDGFTEV